MAHLTILSEFELFLLSGTYTFKTNEVSNLDEVLFSINDDFLREIPHFSEFSFCIALGFNASNLIDVACSAYRHQFLLGRMFGLERLFSSLPILSVSYNGKDFLDALNREESSDEELHEMVKSFFSIDVEYYLTDGSVKEAFDALSSKLDVSVNLDSVWNLRSILKNIRGKLGGPDLIKTMDSELCNMGAVLIFLDDVLLVCVPNRFENPVVTLRGDCKTKLLAILKTDHDIGSGLVQDYKNKHGD